MITPRQSDILNLIVQVFTETREPVGSKALQDSIASSSATIRNDMAKLEKLGLLEKAHTSSGRLPSPAGFKYFVENSLQADQLNEADAYQVVKAFDFEAFKLEDILAVASQLLADMTGYTALCLDVEPAKQTLTGFEIVPLSSHDALAVLTLDDSRPVTVQFAIPRNFLTKDLLKVKEVVKERLLGQPVMAIHYKLRTEIPQIIQRYFTTTDNVLDLFDYIFEKLFKEEVFLAGKVKSLDYADAKTYQFLDNEQSLALALRQTAKEDQPLTVYVAEHSEPALSQLGVMTYQFIIPYRGLGLISLIGPVEMDYARCFSLLSLISQVLTMKLGDYYRYLSSNHYEVN